MRDEEILEIINNELEKWYHIYDELKMKAPHWTTWCAGVINALYQWREAIKLKIQMDKNSKT